MVRGLPRPALPREPYAVDGYLPPQNDAHFFDDARFSTLQPNFILYCCRVDDDARFQVTSSTAR